MQFPPYIKIRYFSSGIALFIASSLLIIPPSLAAGDLSFSRDTSLIVDTDKRHRTVDPAVGRIMPENCTGWLTSFGAVLTAGHCVGPEAEIQFNVPLSSPEGVPKYPNKINRYRLTYIDHKYSGNEDWAIASLDETEGMTAFQRQKYVFRLVSLSDIGTNVSIFANKLAVRVSGFGVDGPPPFYGSKSPRNSLSQTLQTDSGTLLNSEPQDAFILCYDVDTMGGNSGSPVIINGSGYRTLNTGGGGYAIAIHVAGDNQSKHCGRRANIGTILTQPSLLEALQNFGGRNYGPIDKDRIIYLDNNSITAINNGSVLRPYGDIGVATKKAMNMTRNSVVVIESGYYVSKNFSIIPRNDMVISLPAGDAIWNLSED